jgi:NAD dependent epimerase/dehydratase family enzyme
MPTKTQAQRAGISERQRLNLHRNALSRAAQKNTGGSYSKMAKVARARTGGKVGKGRR